MSDTRFTVQSSENGKQLTLPMPLPYRPIPLSISNTDILSIVVIPIYVVVSAIRRAIKKTPPPPRASFVIKQNCFRMELVDPDTGELTEYEFDPEKVVELRKNQYGPGMWIHVSGKIKTTYLYDIDGDTIKAMCAELRSMLPQWDKSPSTDIAK